MKNFIFKSSQDTDLLKLFQKLDIIQAKQRHARFDLKIINEKVQILVQGMAILVSQPEPEDKDATEDNRDRN